MSQHSVPEGMANADSFCLHGGSQIASNGSFEVGSVGYFEALGAASTCLKSHPSPEVSVTANDHLVSFKHDSILDSWQ